MEVYRQANCGLSAGEWLASEELSRCLDISDVSRHGRQDFSTWIKWIQDKSGSYSWGTYWSKTYKNNSVVCFVTLRLAPISLNWLLVALLINIHPDIRRCAIAHIHSNPLIFCGFFPYISCSVVWWALLGNQWCRCDCHVAHCALRLESCAVAVLFLRLLCGHGLHPPLALHSLWLFSSFPGSSEI